MKQSAYKDAGVDIEAGDALVERIKPLAKSTARSGLMGGLGGFGAFFDVKAAGYTDPVMVSATDGVGTKLRIAIDSGIHNTVGIDLVAMCVNDLIVQGGEPLFFLDYFASSKLELDVAEQVISGIAEGCRQAGCALIGGETAEMPGMYEAGDYDLAGFSVGAVERSQILTGEDIGAGDVVLGLASSGPHSNGYSLIRKVIEVSDADLAAILDGRSLGEALLAPTRIYVKPLLSLLNSVEVHALAHITGGGLTENLPRVLPAGSEAVVDLDAWQLPPVFEWIRDQGNIAPDEMLRTFNCGVGMVACLPEGAAEQATALLRDAGETVIPLGRIESSDDPAPRVRYRP